MSKIINKNSFALFFWANLFLVSFCFASVSKKKIEDLPYDCMAQACSFLPKKEVLSLRVVNKLFKKSIDENVPMDLNLKALVSKYSYGFSKNIRVENGENMLKAFSRDNLFSDMKIKNFYVTLELRSIEQFKNLHKHLQKLIFNLDSNTNKFCFLNVYIDDNCANRTVSLAKMPTLKKWKPCKRLWYYDFTRGSHEILFTKKNIKLKENFEVEKAFSLVSLDRLVDISENISGGMYDHFGTNDICFPNGLEKVDIWNSKKFGTNEINFPKSLKRIEIVTCDSFGTNDIDFLNGLEEFYISGCGAFGTNDIYFPNSLKKITVKSSKNFGENEERIVFSEGLKQLDIESCHAFKAKDINFPKSLKNFSINCCETFGREDIDFSNGLEELSVVMCCNFGKNKIVLPKKLVNFQVEYCRSFNEKKFIKEWSEGTYPSLKTFNKKTLKEWQT